MHPKKEFVDAFIAGKKVKYKNVGRGDGWEDVTSFSAFDNNTAQFEVVTDTEQELVNQISTLEEQLRDVQS